MTCTGTEVQRWPLGPVAATDTTYAASPGTGRTTLPVSVSTVAVSSRDREVDLAVRALDAVECVVVVAEVETGTVVAMNRAAEGLTGFRADEVLGGSLEETLVAPSDRSRVQAWFAEPTGEGIPLNSELVVLTRTGARRRVVWSSTFLTTPGGARSHVVMTGVDVSVEEPAGGLFGQLITAASEAPTGTVGLDLVGRVTYVSKGARQLLGYTSAELVGSQFPRSVLDRHPLDPEVAADPDAMAEDRWSLARKDGTRITVVTTVSPVRSSHGEHVGYVVVVRDLIAERRATELLVSALQRESDAVQRLREVERVKEALVATVSHELRTPLTSITGYAEMLADGLGGELTEAQAAQVEAIHRNTERLTRLVEDLLSLSSVESGTFRLERVEFDLREALCQAVGLLDAVSESQGVTTTYQVPREPVMVLGDAAHLERALLNLLTNAVKFTEDGGSVSCSMTVDAERVVVTVRDTGIGIPVEEQDSLFQRFFRSSTANEREIQGSGLGLALVAAIVHGHGGEVAVRSEHLGGSEFTITLPLAGTAGAAAATLGLEAAERQPVG